MNDKKLTKYPLISAQYIFSLNDCRRYNFGYSFNWKEFV